MAAERPTSRQYAKIYTPLPFSPQTKFLTILAICWNMHINAFIVRRNLWYGCWKAHLTYSLTRFHTILATCWKMHINAFIVRIKLRYGCRKAHLEAICWNKDGQQRPHKGWLPKGPLRDRHWKDGNIRMGAERPPFSYPFNIRPPVSYPFNIWGKIFP